MLPSVGRVLCYILLFMEGQGFWLRVVAVSVGEASLLTKALSVGQGGAEPGNDVTEQV